MDIPFMLKKIATPLVLASFLSVAFFGFAAMSYGPDGRMQGDCPFSVTGVSLCPQNALFGAIHHLSAYQSFISVPIGFNLTVLLIALFAFSIALILFWDPPILTPIASAGFLYESPHPPSYNKKRAHWLSLLENSPSFR